MGFHFYSDGTFKVDDKKNDIGGLTYDQRKDALEKLVKEYKIPKPEMVICEKEPNDYIIIHSFLHIDDVKDKDLLTLWKKWNDGLLNEPDIVKRYNLKDIIQDGHNYYYKVAAIIRQEYNMADGGLCGRDIRIIPYSEYAEDFDREGCAYYKQRGYDIKQATPIDAVDKLLTAIPMQESSHQNDILYYFRFINGMDKKSNIYTEFREIRKFLQDTELSYKPELVRYFKNDKVTFRIAPKTAYENEKKEGYYKEQADAVNPIDGVKYEVGFTNLPENPNIDIYIRKAKDGKTYFAYNGTIYEDLNIVLYNLYNLHSFETPEWYGKFEKYQLDYDKALYEKKDEVSEQKVTSPEAKAPAEAKDNSPKRYTYKRRGTGSER